MPVTAPIFIVGMDRSGTTLMSALLDAHPAIAIAPETWFVNHWAAPRAGMDLRNFQILEQFWAEYTAHDFFGLLGLDAAGLHEQAVRLEPRNFQSLFSLILHQYAARAGKRRCGEKTPHHYLHLATLFDWFPQARVIFMVRDPRAVYASFRKTPYGHEWADLHAREWRSMVRELSRWKGDPRVLPVHYEPLVTDPESTLRKVCAHVDEPFDPAMVARAGSERRLETFGGWLLENERRALGAIDLTGIDRWRGELAPYKTAVIEHCAGAAMQSLGYARSQPALSPALWSRMQLGRARRNLRALAERLLAGRRRPIEPTRRASA